MQGAVRNTEIGTSNPTSHRDLAGKYDGVQQQRMLDRSHLDIIEEGVLSSPEGAEQRDTITR